MGAIKWDELLTSDESVDREMFASGESSRTKHFILCGVADAAYARAFARIASPAVYDGMWRQEIRVAPQGGQIYHIDVAYGPRRPEIKWSFDTTGGTAKITHAKEHIVDFAPAGEDPPNHEGAINVNENGDVEGVEVVVPQFKWTEEVELPSDTVDWEYSQILKDLTGKVNASEFRGFGQHEVRFDGAKGGWSNKDPTKTNLIFEFCQQDSTVDLTIGEITGIAKLGWMYAWVEYETKEDSTAKRHTKRAIAVHIERVYDEGAFGDLGIGE